MKHIFSLKTFYLLASLLIVQQSAFAQTANSKFEKVKELEGVEEYLYKPNGLKILLTES